MIGCSSTPSAIQENRAITIGRRFYDQGQYEKAEIHFQELAQDATVHRNPLLFAQSQKWLGTIQLAYRKDDDALRLYVKAKSILDSLRIADGSNRTTTQETLLDEWNNVSNNIAVIEKNEGHFDAATNLHRTILAFDRKRGLPLPIAVSLYNLGLIHSLKADVARRSQMQDEMTLQVDSAKALYMESLSVFPTADAYLNLGNTYGIEKKSDSAVIAFRRAEKIYRENGYKVHQALCLGNIGILLQEMNEAKSAAEALKEGIRIIEELRGNLTSIEVRSSFISNKFYLYENLIDILVSQNAFEEAFEYVERAKARSFLDMLGNKSIGEEKKHSPEASALIAEERQLHTHISRLVERPDSAFVLKSLLLAHQNVLASLTKIDPEYTSVKSIEPLSLHSLQKLLPDSTALLEYFLGETSSFVFIVRRDTIVAKKLRLDAGFGLEQRVEKLRRELYSEFPNRKMQVIREARRTQNKSIHDALKEWYALSTDNSWQFEFVTLYAVFISPVETWLQGVTQLYVVPHGPLHHLPFQALIKPGNNDRKNGMHVARPHFMIEDVAIAYLPSASVLSFARAKQISTNANPVIVGDPTYADPMFRKRPLEGALREADSVAAFAEKPSVLKREAAEEKTVKEKLHSAGFVHLATHGELNKHDPLRSRILLAAANPQGDNDGDLTVAEVFNLDLNASLVTLSACQTAQVASEGGKFTPGDDLVGLTRSFFYAGTPSVIASLWFVDDAATFAWMTSFYKAWLHGGLSKIQAARHASLEMLQNPEDRDWVFPYYWGAFIFFGDM